MSSWNPFQRSRSRTAWDSNLDVSEHGGAYRAAQPPPMPTAGADENTSNRTGCIAALKVLLVQPRRSSWDRDKAIDMSEHGGMYGKKSQTIERKSENLSDSSCLRDVMPGEQSDGSGGDKRRFSQRSDVETLLNLLSEAEELSTQGTRQRLVYE
jgi:hypothetical protein